MSVSRVAAEHNTMKNNLLEAFKKERLFAEEKYHVLLEMEQESRQVSFSPADMAKSIYQAWKKAENLLKNTFPDMENESEDVWTVLTEDGDSYPKPYTAVYAEDETGAQYVASCDTEFKWYVSLGEETHYIPDYIEIVRWRPVASTEKPDLSWPIDLTETLAVELEHVIDTLNDAGSCDITAEELAEKVVDDIKLVHNQLWELRKTLKSSFKETTGAPAEEPLCSYQKCLTCNISTCHTGEIAREQGEEAYNEWIAEMNEAEVITEPQIIKTALLLEELGSAEKDLKTATRILDFLCDVKSHKLDGTIAELGINVLTPKGYSTSVFLYITDGELKTYVITEKGKMRLPVDFPYPGRDLGKSLLERWDIIEERIYKAKEEREKAWNETKTGVTIYFRRPFETADNKIVLLHVKDKNADFVQAVDEFGHEYEFYKTAMNVIIYADKDKAEAYLKATPVKK